MPVIINKDENSTPKYFSSELTGNGKNRGRLTAALNIKNVQKHTGLKKPYAKHKVINNQTTVYYIPVIPIAPKILNKYDIIDISETIKLTNVTIHFMLESITITTEKINNKNQTTVSPGYTIVVKRKQDNITLVKTPLVHPNVEYIIQLLECCTDYVTRPSKDDIETLNKELEKITVYDRVVEYTKIWQNNTVETLKLVLDYTKSNELITEQIKYINEYKIEMETYDKIYNLLKDTLPEAQFETLINIDMNLMLINCLNKLNKTNFINYKKDPSVTIDSKFNDQQRDIITTVEPLSLISAAAGTGKSSTIMGRMEYLNKCGVPYSDITVISFTNAAADNIKAKYPNVNSYTIAKMLDIIYKHNNPNHQLSEIGTLCYTLEAKNTKQVYIIQEFIRKLRNVNMKQSNINAFLELTLYIKEYKDIIKKHLDIINQTTLELEAIFCYLEMETMEIPDEIKCKHLIVDEVQDNSIFDFIYILAYTYQNKNTLMIVGDPSQTLYEFRAANPRALTVIGKSNIFKLYKLETNYRSNTEILEYANTVLETIEANNVAKLKLKSNQIKNIDKDDLTNKVSIKTIQMNVAKSKYEQNSLAEDVYKHAGHFIKSAINDKKKVAVLFQKRATAIKTLNLLKSYDYNVEVLFEPLQSSNNIFSKYIAKEFEKLAFLPDISLIDAICKDINDRAEDLLPKRVSNPYEIANKTLSQWKADNRITLNIIETQYKKKKITKKEALEQIKETLLQQEMKINTIKLMTKKSNKKTIEEILKENDIVISTIHGVKGLEFDRVVLVNDDAFMDQSSLRSYYVALTRATEKELILSYTNDSISKLEQLYNNLLDILP